MSFDLILVTLSLMFFNLVSKPVFVIKLVISGILFSTAVNAEVVVKPLTSGILFSTAVNSVLLAKPLISGIFFSTLSILSSRSLVSVVNLVLEANLEVSIASPLSFNVLYVVFLTTSFLTTCLI